ncbi:hypothetical protein K8I31_18130 [bacterium]|nr:hypothetical protein [bacterium]
MINEAKLYNQICGKIHPWKKYIGLFLILIWNYIFFEQRIRLSIDIMFTTICVFLILDGLKDEIIIQIKKEMNKDS